MSKIGRNDPCPCGSGKKYKKCCLAKTQSTPLSFTRNKIRQEEGRLVSKLLDYNKKKYADKAIMAAWNDFVLGRDIDIFDQTDDSLFASNLTQESMTPEFETIFIPWFLFNWQAEDFPYVEEIEEYETLSFPQQTIVASYLEEIQNKVPPFTQAFIEQSCSRPFSYYLVTHVVTGKQLTVYDIFLEQEITVAEVIGSKTLDVGAIIFGRAITLSDTSVFFGMAPYVIPQVFHQTLVDFREDIKADQGKINTDILAEYDFDLLDFYFDVREQILNPQMPEMRNTDGEKLILIDLIYTLNCSVTQAFEALKTLSLLSDEDLLQEAEYDTDGSLLSLEFPWLVKGNKSNADWNNTVHGHILLEKNKLKISVNSENRADKIKRKITRRLGKRAVFQNALYQNAEKLIEESPASAGAMTAEDEDLAQLPGAQEAIAEMLQSHWKNWLDMSLPALNNQTPRQAARSKKGQELLEALLLDFQKQAKQHPENAPDLSMLRRELGMD